MPTLKISAVRGLSARMFRCPPITVTEDGFVDVDTGDPRARAVLVKYVGSHIRLYPGQVAELAAAGLVLEGGKMRDPIAERAAAEEAARRKAEEDEILEARKREAAKKTTATPEPAKKPASKT